MSRLTSLPQSDSLIEDIQIEGLVHGMAIRASVAGTAVRSVRSPEFPDGYLRLQAEDIPGDNYFESPAGERIPYVTDQTIRYIGEPILLLAGEDHAILNDLASQVEIEYLNPEGEFQQGIQEEISEYCKGNPEAAFEKSEKELSRRYEIGYSRPFSSHLLSVLTYFDEKGRLTVFSPSSYPHADRDNIARLLGTPPRRIVLIVPDREVVQPGHSYQVSRISGLCALLTRASGRPVRMSLTWDEGISFAPRRFPAIVTSRTAIDNSGVPRAMEIVITLDSGAYKTTSHLAAERAALAACGGYQCENLRIRTIVRSSDHPPIGGMSGMGEPQAVFALERQTAILAEKADLDPYSWKRRNLQKNNERSLSVLDDVVKKSGFRRKFAAYEMERKMRSDLASSPSPLRGIGLSLCFHGLGLPGNREAQIKSRFRVQFDTHKKLRILSSLARKNRASYFNAMVQKILDIPAEDVTIAKIDTSIVPDSGPDIASRSVLVGGQILAQSCRTILQRRLKSTPPFDIRREYRSGKPWDPKNLRGKPYANVCWEGTVVEVEIDPISLVPRYKGVWTSLEAGEILTEIPARNTVETAILTEMELAGQSDPQGAPPPIHISFVSLCEEDQCQPFGLGDLAVTGFAPAFASAVSQAAGIAIDSLPVTAQLLQERLQQ